MIKRTTKKIHSLQHPLVKHLVKLRKSSEYRNEQLSVLVPDATVIKEISKTHVPQILFLLEGESPIEAKETYFVPEVILKKITGLSTPDPLVAQFSLPKPSSLQQATSLLALDAISDPGNLGTLIRTALALGWGGVFFLPGCVDPFNDKALRASRGATFRLPYLQGSWTELKELATANKLTPYIADIKGRPLFKTQTAPLLLLSNEAAGLSPEAQKWGERITIPMPGEMESLNVAIAGAILMYGLKPKFQKNGEAISMDF